MSTNYLFKVQTGQTSKLPKSKSHVQLPGVPPHAVGRYLITYLSLLVPTSSASYNYLLLNAGQKPRNVMVAN